MIGKTIEICIGGGWINEVVKINGGCLSERSHGQEY